MKYGQKCGGKNRKIGLTIFPPKSSNFFFHSNVGNYPPNKKFLDNFADTCCVGGQKANFFEQKMTFLKKNYFIQN